MPMPPNLLQTTSKIVDLARSGRLLCARDVFDKMSHRDTVAWNAMLTSYSHSAHYQEAISLFHYMRIENTKPDNFSLTSVLSSCAGACELHHGRKIHALVFLIGYQSFLPVNNSLIDMYAKCLNPNDASKVFNEMSDRNVVSWCSLLLAHTNSRQFDDAKRVFSLIPKKVDIAWNILIAGFARYGVVEECLSLFNKMLGSSIQPDQWTFSAVMNACAESLKFVYGCMVHAFVIKSGWSSAVEAKNSILSFYAELGSQADAMKVFKSITSPTQVSWNAMIDAHMKSGDAVEAYLAFEQLPEKNVVSWTSMIVGYAKNGKGEEAFSFFINMMRSGLLPDDFTFGAALHACSNLAVLGHGQMVHGCIFRQGFHSYLYVGNGLVNMYAKCGDLEGSTLAFSDILHKDLVSWNALLFGFGMHGQGSRALQLYEQMVASGVKPDKVTFIGLLMICSHSGLIKESRIFFESMKSVYGLPHELDHVACMVDMLGRGGYLPDAKQFAKKYSCTSTLTNSCSEALLGACSAYGDIQVGTDVGKALNVLEPDKEMSYVLLSNLYCASGQWKQAEAIRKVMADQGIKKMPGCSWIEVRNNITVFVAGDHVHPNTKEICMILKILEFEMVNIFSLFEN